MKRDELLPGVLEDLHRQWPHIPLTGWTPELLLEALAGQLDETAQ
jgi:hypothetical protein